jgi:hypothetical protein
MHRLTIVVYVLALTHIVGAGTDGRSWWMLALLTALTAPIVFAFTYRVLPAPQPSPTSRGTLRISPDPLAANLGGKGSVPVSAPS